MRVEMGRGVEYTMIPGGNPTSVNYAIRCGILPRCCNRRIVLHGKRSGKIVTALGDKHAMSKEPKGPGHVTLLDSNCNLGGQDEVG